MLDTKIKKSLLCAFAVISTLIQIAPASAEVPKNHNDSSCRAAQPQKKCDGMLSPKPKTQSTIPNQKPVIAAQPADRGKPGNPVAAGRR